MTAPIFTFKEDEWVDPGLILFFSTESSAAKLDEILARYSLTAAQAEAVRVALRRVAVGEIAHGELAEHLETIAVLSFDVALSLQADLWSELLRPVTGMLEAQHDVYPELHAVELLPPPPVPETPHDTLAAEVIARSGAAPSDPVLARRLETTAVAHLKDVRDDAETKAMLMRPVKTGGLGFAPEAADALVRSLAEAKSRIGEVSNKNDAQRAEREAAAAVARARREAKLKELRAKFANAPTVPVVTDPAVVAASATSSAAGKQAVTADFFPDKPEETAEIQKIVRQALVEIPTGELPQEAERTMEQAVDEAVALCGAAPTDPDLRRRFSAMVALYFRDLRDRLETLSKLTMPVASGGLGMERAAAEQAMTVLAAARESFTGTHASRAAEQKSQFVAVQAEKQLTGSDVAKAKEEESLEKSYAALMKRSGLAAPATAPEPAAVARMIQVTTAPKTETAPKVVAPVPEPVIPVSFPKSVFRAPAAEPAVTTVPAPVIAEPPMNLPVAPPDNLPVAPIEPPKPPAPVVMPVAQPKPVQSSVAPSVIAATGTTGGGSTNAKVVDAPVVQKSQVVRTAFVDPPPGDTRRSVITDVQSSPHLTGPVEELRLLNLDDFRRLSKDANEATLKIKDKIDLLAELDYDHRTQAVKAFLESAVNRLYLDALRTTLADGTPVVEVLAATEARGSKTLTKQEFDALMDLNRTLRFG